MAFFRTNKNSGAPLGIVGGAVTDYLLVMTVVAGVAFPLVIKYFGDPIRDTFMNNRETLVQLIAQDNKSTVPNSWFSREDMRASDVGELNETGELAEVELAEPSGDIKVADLRDVGDVGSGAAGMELEVGDLGEPGDVTVAKNPGRGVNVGRGSGGGRGGSAGGASGGFAGSPGAGGMDGDFFGGKKGDNKGSSQGDSGSSSRLYGKGAGGDDEGGGGGEQGGGGTAKQTDSGKDDSSDEQSSASASKRRGNLGLAKIEKEQVKSQYEFDWWQIIKIFLILGILAILVLIALGNMQRRQ